MATVGIIIVLPILILDIVARALIVVFVYKDAKRRNMNPFIWCLVAALVPLMLGLIMYLVCRDPLTELTCPNCGGGVARNDNRCPQCGSVFVTQCPECKFPIQKGWNTCPSCGKELPQDFGQPVKKYKKDNGIFVLIAVAVVVLFALFFAVMTLFKTNNIEEWHGYGGIVGMYNITAEDMKENSTINEWIASCDDKKDAYVLMSTTSDTCLVYVPGQDMLFENDMSLDSNGEKNHVYIYIRTTQYEDKYGYDFVLYGFDVKDDTEVEIYINDRRCDSSVQITDQDISISGWGGQVNEE